MCPNDADRMTNSADPDQTSPHDLGLHSLLRPVCPINYLSTVLFSNYLNLQTDFSASQSNNAPLY